MKKLGILLLALILCFAFAACQNEEAETPGTDDAPISDSQPQNSDQQGTPGNNQSGDAGKDQNGGTDTGNSGGANTDPQEPEDVADDIFENQGNTNGSWTPDMELPD